MTVIARVVVPERYCREAAERCERQLEAERLLARPAFVVSLNDGAGVLAIDGTIGTPGGKEQPMLLDKATAGAIAREIEQGCVVVTYTRYLADAAAALRRIAAMLPPCKCEHADNALQSAARH